MQWQRMSIFKTFPTITEFLEIDSHFVKNSEELNLI